jgi:hypothetical protein
MAAITTSRPVLMPPSSAADAVAQVVQGQHLVASDRPISQGMPAYLIEVCGLAPVPPTLAGDQDHVGLGLGDARPRSVPMPERRPASRRPWRRG